MDTYFDRAFTQMPEFQPHTLNEQRMIWRRKLQDDESLEETFLAVHETYQVEVLINLIVLQEHPAHYNQGELESALTRYVGSRNWVFNQMHRIAYFEGLLKTDKPERDREDDSL